MVHYRKDKIKYLPLAVIFLIISSGFILVGISSRISEFIRPENYFYDYEFTMEPNGTFDRLLFYYDFTEEWGNVSFGIPDDTKRVVMYLDNLKGDSVTSKILTCESIYEDCKDTNSKFDLEVRNNTSRKDKTNYLLVMENLPDIEDRVISIDFGLDIKPVGTFQIYSGKDSQIYGWVYGVRLNLGDRFLCTSGCFQNVRGTDRYFTFSGQDMRITFTDEDVDSRIFRLEGVIDEDERENKQFLFGLGIALLAGGVVEVIISVTRRRENK